MLLYLFAREKTKTQAKILIITDGTVFALCYAMIDHMVQSLRVGAVHREGRDHLVPSGGCLHFFGCDCHPGSHHVQGVGQHRSSGAGQRAGQEAWERRQGSEARDTVI